MQKADPKTIRTTNRWLILRNLYHGYANTRSSLSKTTGLTRVAISDVVNSLIEDGLIDEVGYRSGLLGKPPMILEIPSDARFLIGIQLEVDYLRGVVCDTRMKVLQKKEIALASTEVDEVVRELKAVIHDLAQYNPEKTLGIGISTPGILDANKKIVNYSTNLGWRNVHLLDRIKDDFELPIYLANDTTCASLSEIINGVGKGHQRICTLVIEAGVGAGIAIMDEKYMDVTNGSAEIGHLKILFDSKHIKSEKKEYLIEELIGRKGLEKYITEIAESTQDRELIESLKNGFNAKKIAELAEKGNVYTREFIQDVGFILGKGIAILLNLMHPQVIILSGTICDLGKRLFEKIWEVVESDTLEEYTKKLEILPSNLDNNVVLGAAALLLRYEMGII